MGPDKRVVLGGETSLRGSETSSFWFDPGIHLALAAVTNDIVYALCVLSEKIKEGLSETQTLDGEEQSLIFSHHISDDHNLASIRMDMFHLLAAIACEESINRFCYFELPRDVTETLEKLQPTEKLLVAAAFLGQPNMKSSHVYEGLKSLIGWRNHYAHGHNPGRSTDSLRRNHAVFPEAGEISTLEDDLKELKKAAGHYRQIMAWLHKTGIHEISRVSHLQGHASRLVELLGCFSVTRGWLRPDSEGSRYQFFGVHVNQEKLTSLQKQVYR